jgi:hypothetical protein
MDRSRVAALNRKQNIYSKRWLWQYTTASRTVTWTSDATPPTMLTKNITVQLTAGGNVTITAAQVNNGSFDACGIQILSLNKNTFLCSDIGANTVTLTATDANGNTASANATVTVEDHECQQC